MAFTGNGAGRFQIRRIRNGSTAESLVTANGPLFQDFAMPTGQHTPNWDNTEEAGDLTDWAPGTTYAADAEVDYLGGIYRSIAAGNVGNTPTEGATDDNWEYEGPVGTPLILTPSLLVNGVEQDTTTAFTRSGSPVNALVTNVQWYVLVSGSADTVNTIAPIGSYEAVDTGENGFSLSNTALVIDRNLDDGSMFNDGALQDNMLHLRCRISYNITGVLDASNNLQTLTSDAFVTVRRTVLTESSMFARAFLMNVSAIAGSASEIWNSQFTGQKEIQADLIIGANVANDDSTFDVTYQWYTDNGVLIGGETDRTLVRTRAQVATAEGFYCTVTDVHTGISYNTNTVELRDFLDPIQFIENGTTTVDTGSTGTFTVQPYQNGNPMSGLTGANTVYTFDIRQQANATDTVGTDINFDALALATRFPDNATGRAYGASNADASVGHDNTVGGARIALTDNEIGAFGLFIDYDVVFTSISN